MILSYSYQIWTLLCSTSSLFGLVPYAVHNLNLYFLQGDANVCLAACCHMYSFRGCYKRLKYYWDFDVTWCNTNIDISMYRRLHRWPSKCQGHMDQDIYSLDSSHLCLICGQSDYIMIATHTRVVVTQPVLNMISYGYHIYSPP
jgi:hypothetical protein